MATYNQQAISLFSTQRGNQYHPPINVTNRILVAGGGQGFYFTSTVNDGVALTGTAHGLRIVGNNSETNGTGTVRGTEIKGRSKSANIGVLEGASIDADIGAKTCTTMRAIEAILDGSTGGAVTLAVGIRIANNFQANIATTSYGLQIYRDSFDYTADIQLSGGGLIGGTHADSLKVASGGHVTPKTFQCPRNAGAPDAATAGTYGLMYDTTNNRLYFNNNGTMKYAAFS